MGTQGTTPAVASVSKGPNMAAPTPFTGERRKTEQFIFECKLVIHARANDFTTDAGKIAYVLSYMKGGTAGPWALRYDKRKDAEAIATHGNFDKFIELIEKEFAEVEKNQRARNNLQEIRQHNSSADAFTSRFNELATNTEFDDRALIEFYKKGLNWELVEKIFELATIPTTLAEWQKYAMRFDENKRHIAAEKARIKGGSGGSGRPGGKFRNDYGGYKSSNQYSTNDTTYYGEPMDVDRQRFQKLNNQQRQELMKKGACFYCRETGHISRNCPKKSKGPKRPMRARELSFKDALEQFKETCTNATEEEYEEIVMTTADYKPNF